MGTGSYQILEHTGEIGILARGETPAQAFSQAATGIFSFMVELGSIGEHEVRHVEAQAPDLEGLLVAWLDELIYLFDVEGLVFRKFLISEMDQTHLKAACHGEKLDPERHRINVSPKAATYHMLEVKEDIQGGGWCARAILDI